MRQFCVKNETILRKKWDNFAQKMRQFCIKNETYRLFFLNIDYINNDI